MCIGAGNDEEEKKMIALTTKNRTSRFTFNKPSQSSSNSGKIDEITIALAMVSLLGYDVALPRNISSY